MLATSWSAKGLVRAAWLRLDTAKDKRGELARLTGIPATNLSGMNSGRRPMTPEAAERIAAAVPGLTVKDLGRPEDVSAPDVSRQLRQMVREEVRAALVPIEQLLQRLADQAPPGPRKAGDGDQ